MTSDQTQSRLQPETDPQDPVQRLHQLLEGRVEVDYQINKLTTDKRAIDEEIKEYVSESEKLELGRYTVNRTTFARETVDDKAWKLACAKDPALNEIDRAYRAARANFSRQSVIDYIKVTVK